MSAGSRIKRFLKFSFIGIGLVVILWIGWMHRPFFGEIAMDGPVAGWMDYGNDRGGTRY